MSYTPLTEDEITEHLHALKGWEYKDNALYKTFSFENFRDAFSFMSRVALAAESLNHHPDWCNTYNEVSVKLTTHDIQALSMKDIELAIAMDHLRDKKLVKE